MSTSGSCHAEEEEAAVEKINRWVIIITLKPSERENDPVYDYYYVVDDIQESK